MSDQTVLLPKWFSHRAIILAKGEFGHLYTFGTMPIMVFIPVYFFWYTLYDQFLFEKILPIKQILRMDKNYTGEELLWLQFAFLNEKKNVFFAKFLRFLGFSQSQQPGGKILDWYIICTFLCWIFDTNVDPGSELI